MDQVKDYVTCLEAAILDIVGDSPYWWKIEEKTGLPPERCKVLSKLVNEISLHQGNVDISAVIETQPQPTQKKRGWPKGKPRKHVDQQPTH